MASALQMTGASLNVLQREFPLPLLVGLDDRSVAITGITSYL